MGKGFAIVVFLFSLGLVGVIALATHSVVEKLEQIRAIVADINTRMQIEQEQRELQNAR